MRAHGAVFFIMARIFAIGDVHGCLAPLRHLLQHINPQADDTLVFLGDLIDRGSDSKGVVDCVMQLQTQCHVQCIMGNHEEMLLTAQYDKDVREAWLYHGGQETLQSFGLPPTKIGLAQIPQVYIAFFQNMLPFAETPQYILTHATPVMDIPIEKQDAHGLRWSRVRMGSPYQHISQKMVVCGHSAQISGKPYAKQGVVVIDTHAYGSGWLTALELHSQTIHQANSAGAHTSTALEWSD